MTTATASLPDGRLRSHARLRRPCRPALELTLDARSYLASASGSLLPAATLRVRAAGLRSRAPHDARPHLASAFGPPIPAVTLRVSTRAPLLGRSDSPRSAAEIGSEFEEVGGRHASLFELTHDARSSAGRRLRPAGPGGALRDGDTHALRSPLIAPASLNSVLGRLRRPCGPAQPLRSRAPHDARSHLASASGSPVPAATPAGPGRRLRSRAPHVESHALSWPPPQNAPPRPNPERPVSRPP
jgi:hypothetical protein